MLEKGERMPDFNFMAPLNHQEVKIYFEKQKFIPPPVKLLSNNNLS